MTRHDLPLAVSSAKPSRRLPAVRTLLLAASVAALSALSPARAQDSTPTDAIAACTQADSQASISSCSDLINSGNLAPLDLARALTRRASIYVAGVDWFGDADRAVTILRSLPESHPNELAEALYWRAQVHRENNEDYRRAVADLTQAISLRPAFYQAYLERGDAYSALGDNRRALADYNATLRIDPENAKAYASRSSTRMALNDYDGAMQDSAAAARISSTYDAMGEQAQQYEQQQAQAAADQARQTTDNTAVTNLILGGVAAAAGADANTVANVMTGNYAAAAAPPPVQQQQQQAASPPSGGRASTYVGNQQVTAANAPAAVFNSCIQVRQPMTDAQSDWHLVNTCPYFLEVVISMDGRILPLSRNPIYVDANAGRGLGQGREVGSVGVIIACRNNQLNWDSGGTNYRCEQ